MISAKLSYSLRRTLINYRSGEKVVLICRSLDLHRLCAVQERSAPPFHSFPDHARLFSRPSRVVYYVLGHLGTFSQGLRSRDLTSVRQLTTSHFCWTYLLGFSSADEVKGDKDMLEK